ncbi:VWA domain-containing protein [bacterium]|nr:VWA domain-containing protein [bacterium]
MSLDEKIFGSVWNFFSTLKSNHEFPHAVYLKNVHERLTHFSSIVCGRPITLIPCVKTGSFDGITFYLPQVCNLYSELSLNYEAYLFRIMFSCSLWNEFSKPQALVVLPDDIKNYLILKLTADWPQFGALYMRLMGASLVEGVFPKNRDDFLFGKMPVWQKLDTLGEESTFGEATQKGGYDITIKDRPQQVELSSEPENPLVHSFEKVHTAEDYQGGNKNKDGSDSGDMSDALGEVEFDTVILTNQSAQGRVNVDSGFLLDNKSSELLPGKCTFVYPEWQTSKKIYKKEWCTVYENKTNGLRAELGDITLLKKMATQVAMNIAPNVRRFKKNEKEGEEPDLDGLVRYHADCLSKNVDEPRLYLKQKRMENNFALLFLADTSQSTEGWLGDVEIISLVREALMVSALSLQKAGLGQYALASFYSHTRHQCSFEIIKSFDDVMSLENEKRILLAIQALRPKGYTRIGPAIRHATHLLNKVSAKKRVLVVLSDAKPSDYDGYEGRYGFEDVLKASHEAKACGIGFSAFAFSHASQKKAHDLFGGKVFRASSIHQFARGLAQLMRELVVS